MTKRERGRPPRPVPGVRRQYLLDADLVEWLEQHKNKSAIVNLALRSLKDHKLSEQEIYKLLSSFGND